MQNYRCKDCGRQFRVTTGTFVYRLQKKEKMLDYIRCMIAGKVSELVLKKWASVYQQASLGDTRYWQLYKVSKIISIFRVVEMDELLMDYSEKGRIYKNAEELKRARKQSQRK